MIDNNNPKEQKENENDKNIEAQIKKENESYLKSDKSLESDNINEPTLEKKNEKSNDNDNKNENENEKENNDIQKPFAFVNDGFEIDGGGDINDNEITEDNMEINNNNNNKIENKKSLNSKKEVYKKKVPRKGGKVKNKSKVNFADIIDNNNNSKETEKIEKIINILPSSPEIKQKEKEKEEDNKSEKKYILDSVNSISSSYFDNSDVNESIRKRFSSIVSR